MSTSLRTSRRSPPFQTGCSPFLSSSRFVTAVEKRGSCSFALKLTVQTTKCSQSTVFYAAKMSLTMNIGQKQLAIRTPLFRSSGLISGRTWAIRWPKSPHGWSSTKVWSPCFQEVAASTHLSGVLRSFKSSRSQSGGTMNLTCKCMLLQRTSQSSKVQRPSSIPSPLNWGSCPRLSL
jgi:hypothetical protein